MRSDDELLQQHAVHSARLVSAFIHGRRRSWAERRSLTSAVLVGGLLAVAVAFGSGVTVVVREQLAAGEHRAFGDDVAETLGRVWHGVQLRPLLRRARLGPDPPSVLNGA